MKITKFLLTSYLDKIGMSNTAHEARLNFAPDGILAKVMVSSMHYFCQGKLTSNAIEKYEAVGEIGVKDLSKLRSFSDRFKKDIVVKVKKNLLEMKDDSKKVVISLADKDFIEETPDLDLKYDIILQVPTKELKDCAADSRVFEASNKPSVTVELNTDGKLILRASAGEEVIEKTLKTEIIGKEASVRLDADYFGKIVKCITEENVMLYLKSDYPIQISETSSYIKMFYMIAPKTQESGTEQQEDMEGDEIEVIKGGSNESDMDGEV